MGGVDAGDQGLTLNSERLTLASLDPRLATAMGRSPEEFLKALGATADPDRVILPTPRDARVIAHELERRPESAGWVSWYIQRASDRKLIGSFSFYWDPTDVTTVFVGYDVCPSERGKGYATEALKTLIPWIFEHPNVTRLCAEADRMNLASIRVLEKVGMTPLHRPADGHVAYEIQAPGKEDVEKTYPKVLARLSPFVYSEREKQHRVWTWLWSHSWRRSELWLAVFIPVFVVLAQPSLWPIAALAAALVLIYLVMDVMVLSRRPGSEFQVYLDAVHRLQIRDNGLYWPSLEGSSRLHPWEDVLYAIDNGGWIDIVFRGRDQVDLREAYRHPGLIEHARQAFIEVGVKLKPPH